VHKFHQYNRFILTYTTVT